MVSESAVRLLLGFPIASVISVMIFRRPFSRVKRASLALRMKFARSDGFAVQAAFCLRLQKGSLEPSRARPACVREQKAVVRMSLRIDHKLSFGEEIRILSAVAPCVGAV